MPLSSSSLGHSGELHSQKNDESINKLVDGVSAFKREDRTINDLDKYLQKNISKISDEYLEKLEDLLKYFKLYENYLKKLKKYDFDDFLQITVNEKLVKDSLEKEIKTREWNSKLKLPISLKMKQLVSISFSMPISI